MASHGSDQAGCHSSTTSGDPTDDPEPWVNGGGSASRPADKWIPDFGWSMPETEAALHEAPSYTRARASVRCCNGAVARPAASTGGSCRTESDDIWQALEGMACCIVVTTLANHRLFGWLDAFVCPDDRLTVIARDDNTTFGILCSRFHAAWSLWLET